jgi:hypothetical protein
MNREETIEKIENLQNILSRIKYLVDEAGALLEGTEEALSAKGIWMAHIITALDNQHDYSRNPITMQDSINCLRESINLEKVEHNKY